MSQPEGVAQPETGVPPADPEIVEVRCPVGPRRLFTKLRLGEETARMVQPANLIEFSCSDCTGRARQRGQDVKVFHRFNFAGYLVETIRIPTGEAP